MPKPLPDKDYLATFVPHEILDLYYGYYVDIQKRAEAAAQAGNGNLNLIRRVADLVHRKFCVSCEFLKANGIRIWGAKYKHIVAPYPLDNLDFVLALLNSDMLNADPYETSTLTVNVPDEERPLVKACITLYFCRSAMPFLDLLMDAPVDLIRPIADTILRTTVVYAATQTLRLPEFVEAAASNKLGAKFRRIGKNKAEGMQIVKDIAEQILTGPDRKAYIKPRVLLVRRKELADEIADRLKTDKGIEVASGTINNDYLKELIDELNVFVKQTQPNS